MPNAVAHRYGAAVGIGCTIAIHEHNNGESSARPFLGAAGGALFGTLPDILEPAFHPNHRQFFHSFAALGLVSTGLYKLYKWEPDDDFGKAVRGVSMLACGAYIVHLVMDAGTRKSLPLIGGI